MIPIESCADFKSILTKNATVCYYLTKDLNCTGQPISPIGSGSSSFEGGFDGRNHKITGLSLLPRDDFVGLFAYVSRATILNLTLEDVSVESGAYFVSALASYTFDSHILNCHLTASAGKVSVVQGKGSLNVAGFVSNARSTHFHNCTLQNTVILNDNGPSGGVLGRGLACSICHATHLGNSNGEVLVESKNYAGGLVGLCEQCSIFKSGIVEGKVNAVEQVAGGVAAKFVDPVQVEELYASSSVLVNANRGFAGGIFGWVEIDNGTHVFDNCYSRATVSGMNNLGGMFGVFKFGANNGTSLLLSHCYAYIVIYTSSVTDFFGAILGNLAADSPNYTLSFSNVFFLNNLNNGLGNGKTSTDGSSVVPLKCDPLYEAILDNFPHTVWGGDRLRIEYGYKFGENTCFRPPPDDSWKLGLALGLLIPFSMGAIAFLGIWIYFRRQTPYSSTLQTQPIEINEIETADESENIERSQTEPIN